MQQPGPPVGLPNPHETAYYTAQSDQNLPWHIQQQQHQQQQQQQNGHYQAQAQAQAQHSPYQPGYGYNYAQASEGYGAGPSQLPPAPSYQYQPYHQSQQQPGLPTNVQEPSYYPSNSNLPGNQQHIPQHHYQQPSQQQQQPYYPQQQPYQPHLQQQQQQYEQPGPSYIKPTPMPSVEAVPQPQPKVAYEAPVFQTFQERRRAKEMALRAQAGTPPIPSSTFTPPPPLPPSSSLSSSTSSIPRVPSVGPRSPSPLSAGTGPSASAVAMMGRPQSMTNMSGPPPAPPARSRSPAIPPIVVPSAIPSASGSTTPNSQANSSRPLPSPRALPPVTPNGVPPSNHVNMKAASGSSSPFTPTHSNSPSPAAFSPPPSVVASPIQANLERSDTISSVKSLDRMGFGSSSPVKRALPRPPVGVNSSKSLDRGIPAGVGSFTGLDGRRGSSSSTVSVASPSKRPPSVVIEEQLPDALAQGIAAMSVGTSAGTRTRTPSPAIPTIRTPSPSPSPNPPPPVIVVPGQTGSAEPPADPHTPARYTPLPAISLPDSETSSMTSTETENEDEVGSCGHQHDTNATPRAKKTAVSAAQGPAPPSPEIQFSGLPTISVSTSDSADEPEQGGEISFVVPSINVGREGEQAAPSSASSVPSIAIGGVPSISVPTSSNASQSKPTRVQHDGSAILCAGCENPIIGRIVNAMGQRWHPQCFMCAECGELLEHVSSYEWEGKAYCHLDYHDKFAHRCHHCQTPIVDPRFVTLNDPVLGQRYYHELHFFCSECGDPFLDPSKSSAPGTETSRPNGHASHDDNAVVGQEEEEEEEGETNAFVIHRGHPYCEKCHLRLHKPKCKGCGQPIPDIAINAMGAKWHKECFVCTRCHNEFANNLFFPKDGQAFCTSCYEQIIGAS